MNALFTRLGLGRNDGGAADGSDVEAGRGGGQRVLPFGIDMEEAGASVAPNNASQAGAGGGAEAGQQGQQQQAENRGNEANNQQPRTAAGIFRSFITRSMRAMSSQKYLLGAAIVHFLVEFVAAGVIIIMSWSAECPDPLRAYILVRVALMAVRLQFYILSVRAERRNPGGRSPAKNMVGVLESVQFIWFVLGNVWLFGSTCADSNPILYYGVLGFLAESYLIYGLPGIIVMMMMCILPVAICVLRAKARERARERERIIESLPSMRFRRDMTEDDNPTCCICLDEYEEGTRVRKLKCNHFYHQACIDEWLKKNLECPLCKARVGPDSGDSDGRREREESDGQRQREGRVQQGSEGGVAGSVVGGVIADMSGDQHGASVAHRDEEGFSSDSEIRLPPPPSPPSSVEMGDLSSSPEAERRSLIDRADRV
uniref:RING-type domain-containing protein n=1 Tax=Palpitomonas bilix TaxID=652834 RepID=A0A7S3DEG4_9EUKA|mmetsp:Transcript_33933/g.87125  ORF Transcript_33933/g.87125 Transcript_33933/m.87125 type:complete len:428 (+) Transcript_33933:110-1393(+)